MPTVVRPTGAVLGPNPLATRPANQVPVVVPDSESLRLASDDFEGAVQLVCRLRIAGCSCGWGASTRTAPWPVQIGFGGFGRAIRDHRGKDVGVPTGSALATRFQEPIAPPGGRDQLGVVEEAIGDRGRTGVTPTTRTAVWPGWPRFSGLFSRGCRSWQELCGTALDAVDQHVWGIDVYHISNRYRPVRHRINN